jgi:hypothetical protein
LTGDDVPGSVVEVTVTAQAEAVRARTARRATNRVLRVLIGFPPLVVFSL